MKLAGWLEKPVHYCWSLYFTEETLKRIASDLCFPAGWQGIQKKQRTKDGSSNSHITKKSVWFISSVFTAIGDLRPNPNPTEITGKSLIDSMGFESGPLHLIPFCISGNWASSVLNDFKWLLMIAIYDWHAWISSYTSSERLSVPYLVHTGGNKTYKKPFP